jgi:hypothetical protein
MQHPTRQSADAATQGQDLGGHRAILSFPTTPDHNRDAINAIMIGTPNINKAHRDDHPDRKRGLATAESPSRLESLPAELRDQILLHAPDLPTLRALFHASPVMHAQYRSNREKILRTCVHRELDGLFVDAYACLKSQSSISMKDTTDVLEVYRGWLSDSNPHAEVNSVSQSSIQWLAKFHLSVVRPLSRRYSMWALANLARATAASAAPATTATTAMAVAATTAGDWSVTLSRSEERRIFQAVYRYETYHRLFTPDDTRPLWGGFFLSDHVNHMFFGLFDPWEGEAVGCINLFVHQEYAIMFRKISKDLHPESPRFRNADGSVTSEGSFDFDSVHEFSSKNHQPNGIEKAPYTN